MGLEFRLDGFRNVPLVPPPTFAFVTLLICGLCKKLLPSLGVPATLGSCEEKDEGDGDGDGSREKGGEATLV